MDYRLTEPHDPEAEDAPEVETITCAECDHVVPVDGTDTEPEPVKIGDWWYCRDCAEIILCVDRFDDVRLDEERE